jgi:hypothetical protein
VQGNLKLSIIAVPTNSSDKSNFAKAPNAIRDQDASPAATISLIIRIRVDKE